MSDQRDDLAGLADKGNAMKDGPITFVGESNLSEFNMSIERGALDGLRFICPGRSGVEEAKITFSPGHGQGGFR